MNILQSLCITVKPLQAGDYISRHLEGISNILRHAQDELDINVAPSGECTILLPKKYCSVRAQALADRLSGLRDEHGHFILESQLACQADMRAARVMPSVTQLRRAQERL